MEEKVTPVPATQYKYEITAGYKGLEGGGPAFVGVSVK